MSSTASIRVRQQTAAPGGAPRIGIPCTPSEARNLVRGTSIDLCMNAVKANGGTPVLLPVPDSYAATYDPYNHPFSESAARDIVDGVDALLIPGGPDIQPWFYRQENNGSRPGDPVFDSYELMLARQGFAAGKPMLGIGRGMQMLNVAAGGDLVGDIASGVRRPYDVQQYHEQPPNGSAPIHPVLIGDEGLGRTPVLRTLFSTSSLSVNSAHHQCLYNVAAPLAVVARASDGIIEAIEAKQNPTQWGVQWHPEQQLADAQARGDNSPNRIFRRLVLDASGSGGAAVQPQQPAARPEPAAPAAPRHKKSTHATPAPLPRTADEDALIGAMFPMLTG